METEIKSLAAPSVRAVLSRVFQEVYRRLMSLFRQESVPLFDIHSLLEHCHKILGDPLVEEEFCLQKVIEIIEKLEFENSHFRKETLEQLLRQAFKIGRPTVVKTVVEALLQAGASPEQVYGGVLEQYCSELPAPDNFKIQQLYEALNGCFMFQDKLNGLKSQCPEQKKLKYEKLCADIADVPVKTPYPLHLDKVNELVNEFKGSLETVEEASFSDEVHQVVSNFFKKSICYRYLAEFILDDLTEDCKISAMIKATDDSNCLKIVDFIHPYLSSDNKEWWWYVNDTPAGSGDDDEDEQQTTAGTTSGDDDEDEQQTTRRSYSP